MRGSNANPETFDHHLLRRFDVSILDDALGTTPACRMSELVSS